MKIAITGGEGFIGTRLRGLLAQDDHTCEIIDIRSEEPVDILDLPALTKAMEGCNVIYHLAAEHADNVFPREKYYDVNVKGTKNVVAAAVANGIKNIIFTSSFAVYGLNTGGPNETFETIPFNDYGMSKLEAEEVLHQWARGDDTRNLTIVRPTVVFGEGNRGNVYNLIKQVASGRFIMIGSGKNRKSMAYVGNVTEFLRFCLHQEGRDETYNYADTPDLTMNELIHVIGRHMRRKSSTVRMPYIIGLSAGYVFDGLVKITGKTFPVSAIRIKKFCAETTCDARKARNKGFAPPYTLADGLGRMIKFDFSSQ